MNGPTMERILEAFRDYWAHVQDSPIDEIEAFIPMAYERLALIGADLETSEIVMRPYEDRLFKERAARSRKQRPRCTHVKAKGARA